MPVGLPPSLPGSLRPGAWATDTARRPPARPRAIPVPGRIGDQPAGDWELGTSGSASGPGGTARRAAGAPADSTRPPAHARLALFQLMPRVRSPSWPRGRAPAAAADLSKRTTQVPVRCRPGPRRAHQLACMHAGAELCQLVCDSAVIRQGELPPEYRPITARPLQLGTWFWKTVNVEAGPRYY